MSALGPLFRAGLYIGVLAGALVLTVGGLDFALHQTTQQISQLRISVEPSRLRRSPVGPTPVVSPKDVNAARVTAVTVTGEAAQAQMGLADVDPTTTGSVASPVAQPARDLFRVEANGLNVRSQPNKHGARIMVLEAGEEVQVAERDRNWVRVVRADGRGGWVYSKYLVPVD